jgi:hypothetical protein
MQTITNSFYCQNALSSLKFSNIKDFKCDLENNDIVHYKYDVINKHCDLKNVINDMITNADLISLGSKHACVSIVKNINKNQDNIDLSKIWGVLVYSNGRIIMALQNNTLQNTQNIGVINLDDVIKEFYTLQDSKLTYSSIIMVGLGVLFSVWCISNIKNKIK